MPTQARPDTAALLREIRELLPGLRAQARRHDQEASFPCDGMAKLRDRGLLTATIPVEFGGLGVGEGERGEELLELLRLLGSAELALGRIYEAHVNVIELIRCYGSTRQMEMAAAAAHAGELFALWVTDPAKGALQLTDEQLAGEKWFCSAAGAAQRCLVTVETGNGAQMLFVTAGGSLRVTERGIKLAGMRAATTGSVDFTGTQVGPDDRIGEIGDYLGEPTFSLGAWRSSAVALGGLAALIETAKTELVSRGRAEHPLQRMRHGQALIAYETGRLWLSQAVKRMGDTAGHGDGAIAYVNLARTAVESACLDTLRLVQRSLGLSAFIQGSDAERIARDLATYLRQPAPDAVLDEAAAYFLAQEGAGL